MRNYEMFSGDKLITADLIQRHRLRLLIHSRFYYRMSISFIADYTWDKWARELMDLQNNNPEISEKVMWYDAFRGWDAVTGMDLPLDDEWVVNACNKLLEISSSQAKAMKPVPNKKPETKSKTVAKRLF